LDRKLAISISTAQARHFATVDQEGGGTEREAHAPKDSWSPAQIEGLRFITVGAASKS
jgi:hypothetical protein